VHQKSINSINQLRIVHGRLATGKIGRPKVVAQTACSWGD